MPLNEKELFYSFTAAGVVVFVMLLGFQLIRDVGGEQFSFVYFLLFGGGCGFVFARASQGGWVRRAMTIVGTLALLGAVTSCVFALTS